MIDPCLSLLFIIDPDLFWINLIERKRLKSQIKGAIYIVMNLSNIKII